MSVKWSFITVIEGHELTYIALIIYIMISKAMFFWSQET